MVDDSPYNVSQDKLAQSSEYSSSSIIKPFWITGRLGRVRYLLYSLASIILLVPLAFCLLGRAILEDNKLIISISYILVVILLIVFTLLTIQRLHDCDSRGWWVLVFFPYFIFYDSLYLSFIITFPLFFLLFMVIPGTQGSNQFGPQPPPNTAIGFLIFLLTFVTCYLAIMMITFCEGWFVPI